MPHVDPLVIKLQVHTILIFFFGVRLLAQVNVVLSLDDSSIECAQLFVRFFGHVVQRLYFVRDQESWRVQVLLNVVKAQYLLDCAILKHHIVLYIALLLVMLLNGLLNHLQGRVVVLVGVL